MKEENQQLLCQVEAKQAQVPTLYITADIAVWLYCVVCMYMCVACVVYCSLQNVYMYTVQMAFLINTGSDVQIGF